MRTTVLMSTATAALAAGALVAGAGTAAAQAPTEDPAGCVVVEIFTGQLRCMNLEPSVMDAIGSAGYGSAGTGSLADLLSMLVATGSNTLSVDVPNLTGSYAPGSLGSYGPEAAVGELSTASLGTVVQGSMGS